MLRLFSPAHRGAGIVVVVTCIAALSTQRTLRHCDKSPEHSESAAHSTQRWHTSLTREAHRFGRRKAVRGAQRAGRSARCSAPHLLRATWLRGRRSQGRRQDTRRARCSPTQTPERHRSTRQRGPVDRCAARALCGSAARRSSGGGRERGGAHQCSGGSSTPKTGPTRRHRQPVPPQGGAGTAAAQASGAGQHTWRGGPARHAAGGDSLVHCRT